MGTLTRDVACYCGESRRAKEACKRAFSPLDGFRDLFTQAEAPNSPVVRMLMPVLRLSHSPSLCCGPPPRLWVAGQGSDICRTLFMRPLWMSSRKRDNRIHMNSLVWKRIRTISPSLLLIAWVYFVSGLTLGAHHLEFANDFTNTQIFWALIMIQDLLLQVCSSCWMLPTRGEFSVTLNWR